MSDHIVKIVPKDVNTDMSQEKVSEVIQFLTRYAGLES